MTAVVAMTGAASGENTPPAVSLLHTQDLAPGLVPDPSQDRAEGARPPTRAPICAQPLTRAPPICAHVFARVRARRTAGTTTWGTTPIVGGTSIRLVVSPMVLVLVPVLVLVLVGEARQAVPGGDPVVPLPSLTLHQPRLALLANLISHAVSGSSESSGASSDHLLDHLAFNC